MIDSGRTRVVITGMGAVSSLGLDAKAMWEQLREGRSGIRPLRHPDSEQLRVKIAAQVPEAFEQVCELTATQLSLMDRNSQMAVHAAREAVAQSGIDFTRGSDAENAAVILGCGIGGELTRDEQTRHLYRDDSPRVHPFTIVRSMANAPASHISIAYKLHGPSYVVVSACASANHALIQAAHLVRSGQTDVALSGGTEAYLSYSCLRAWESMRILTQDTCRPFSADRSGLVLGEGAAIFVLESLEHARGRGAEILCELAGGGMSADGTDVVLPSAEGEALAIRRALTDARLSVDDIDYVNAHGTGTKANDSTETRAIHLVFQERAKRLAISSSKSMHGHALGAAGALELVSVIGALREGVVSPTANYTKADPQCDLDYVPNTARAMTVRAALSNSFAFGGLNAVLALKSAP